MQLGDVTTHELALPTLTSQLWRVDTTCPWEPLSTAQERWDGPAGVVLLDSLIATVESFERLRPSAAHGPIPWVVRWAGENYILAGHNRLAIRKLRGHLAAEVRLLILPPEPGAQASSNGKSRLAKSDS